MTDARFLDISDLEQFGESCRKNAQRVVLTNGCFDILHLGHVSYLHDARALGDVLVVAVNSDESVRKLKGPSRPINSSSERALVLLALRSVDAVVVFDTERVVPIIQALKPDIYTKGGDYTVDSLDPTEVAALRQVHAEIKILKLVPGKSTTETINKLKT